MPLHKTPFKVAIPDSQLQDLRNAITASRLPPPFYEGQHEKFGVTSEWMRTAKDRWLNGYDWRAFENKINSYPQFLSDVPFEGGTFKIHYIHKPSSKPNATPIPLLLLHGWPGSFVEFLGVINGLSENGFDVVAPSSPGYCFSQKTPVDKHMGLTEWTKLSDELMRGLGYEEYAVQAGDWAARVSASLGRHYPACKAVHQNVIFSLRQPEGFDDKSLSEYDKEGLERTKAWSYTGLAYALEQATRPSTISHVLYASPLALLAWIGEKFIQWTDETPSLDRILDVVTLWYLTDTYPYSIFSYREVMVGGPYADPDWIMAYQPKPFAYSAFAKELARYPRSWVAHYSNLQWYRSHDEGGHFAAFEKPDIFVKDVTDAFAVLWPMRQQHKL